MTDFNQFGSIQPGQTGDPQHCAQCEAMLIDALDGTLSAADQATFELHILGCPGCTEMLADARRGAEWMELLHAPRPEPPANLLERILSQTSGPASLQISGVPARGAVLSSDVSSAVSDSPRPGPRPSNTLLGHPIPATSPSITIASSNVLPFRTRVRSGLRSLGQTMLQPRLAMTAAMAFFSIALTLNLTGIRLSQLHASDLRPSSIMRTCYEAKAKVVRYSDNLRVVYELESRVRDLQQPSEESRPSGSTAAPDSPAEPAAQPEQKPGSDQHPTNGREPAQKQSRPKPGPGSSRREVPSGTIRQADSFRRLYPNPAGTEALAVAPFVVKPEGALV